MQPIVLKQLPADMPLTELMQTLRIRAGSEDEKDFTQMLNEAQQLANPKACYRVALIEEREESRVKIGNVWFTSRVLAVNLNQTEQVFPFVVTCGMELEEWSEGITDMFWRYWADAIKEAALHSALNAFFAHLRKAHHPGHVSTMSPGSLENWPISEQIPLFELLGDTGEKAGVHLTDSILMRPTKSVSGIVFPRDESFTSCEMCPRLECPNRRAPYDETLFEREYCPKPG